LNGNNPVPSTSENTTPVREDTSASGGTAPGWVAKTGRHLQLINTSIYEKDNQIRAKAMEETRKQKMKRRDEREKAKLHKHIQRVAVGHDGDIGLSTQPAANYEIDVQGVRFRVTRDGSKLAKVSGETSGPGCAQKWK
jgi:putative component of toxin-antitoxin plasmid stabilization module